MRLHILRAQLPVLLRQCLRPTSCLHTHMLLLLLPSLRRRSTNGMAASRVAPSAAPPATWQLQQTTPWQPLEGWAPLLQQLLLGPTRC